MRTFLGMLLLLVSFNSVAESRIAVGKDIVHRKDINSFVAVDYGYLNVFMWENNYAIGMSKEWGNTFKFGVGGIQVHETEKSLGTNLNFLLTLGWCGETMCVLIRHISHGSSYLGIADDKPNAGLNFLTLGATW